MLVAAIKADALSSSDKLVFDPAPSAPTDTFASDDSPSSSFSPMAGGLQRTASAAVMNSTFSHTLLKRAQLSSIWNASDVGCGQTDSHCALAHTSLVALVKMAGDAKFTPELPSTIAVQFPNVDFKCDGDAGSCTLVAAVHVDAALQSVGDVVAMGAGGQWNAVFDNASDATTLDASRHIVLATVRMKSTATSFRVLQARYDPMQCDGLPKCSQTIIALRSVGPLSVEGDGRRSTELLLSGFVIEALDDGRSRVACVDSSTHWHMRS